MKDASAEYLYAQGSMDPRQERREWKIDCPAFPVIEKRDVGKHIKNCILSFFLSSSYP